MRIEVAGIPAPQGSKRHVGGGRMVESSRAVGPWRDDVRTETQRVMRTHVAFDGPVAATITFYLDRPKSTPKRVKYPAKRPDLDKLVRAVLDGLQAGGAFHDDAQVVRLAARKVFYGDHDVRGCLIDIETED